MTKVFEPEAQGVRQIFEPETVRNDFAGIFNNRDKVESILAGYSGADLEKLLNEEIGNMDEPTKRRMLRESGTVKNFLRRVMGQVVVRLVSDKLVKEYGSRVIGALGLGAVGTAVASGTDLFSNLSAEQQDIFAPFLERISSYDSSDVTMVTELIKPEDIDPSVGIFEWLEALFS